MVAALEVIRGIIRIDRGVDVLGQRTVAGRALRRVGGLAAERLAGAVEDRRVHRVSIRIPPVIKPFQLVPVPLRRRHRVT